MDCFILRLSPKKKKKQATKAVQRPGNEATKWIYHEPEFAGTIFTVCLCMELLKIAHIVTVSGSTLLWPLQKFAV